MQKKGMNKHIASLICLLAAIAAFGGAVASCSADEPVPQTMLVVEGWIDEGEFPVVMLSTTVPISNRPSNLDNVTDNAIRWAHVTVSDGERTETLIGTLDTTYFPPFIYTSHNMRGQAGKTYHLKVDYNDMHAEATTTVPEGIDADSMRIQPTRENNDLYSIQAWVHNDSSQPRFLRVFTHDGLIRRQWLSSVEGTTLTLPAGEKYSFTVFRGVNSVNGKQHNPNFSLGEEVSIKLATMDSTSYHFWCDINDKSVSTRIPFMTSHRNARTNVQGALGYWCGFGSRVYKMKIEENARQD